MRAGKLDRLIRIERWEDNPEPNEYGTVTPAFVKRADVRAEIVQASTDEFIRASGASDDNVIIFRTRFIPGVVNEDRIAYAGEVFDIKEVKPIGRNKGLEIRCVSRS